MAVGTALSELRAMFKAECGLELDETVSSGENARINRLLSNTQKWLVGQHGYLLGKATADITITATRYHTFPTSELDIDRLEKQRAVVKVGATNDPKQRYWADYGITQEQYLTYDSEIGEAADPIQRWQLIRVAGVIKIEVWPIPQSTQVLNLTGLYPLQALTSDAHTCQVDDLLIVYWAAAKYLARRGDKDATAMLNQAQTQLHGLKAAQPSKFEVFNMTGRGNRPLRNEPRPIIGVSNV